MDSILYIYISWEMTPISIGGEKQASISGGSHLPADIAKSRKSPISIVKNNKQWIGACGLDNIRKSAVPSDILWNSYFVMNKQ